MTLTHLEAFRAMHDFLSEVYQRTESDELAVLLGSMSLLPDGKPVDPAIWSDWLASVQRAKKGVVDAALEIDNETSDEGLD